MLSCRHILVVTHALLIYVFVLIAVTVVLHKGILMA